MTARIDPPPCYPGELLAAHIDTRCDRRCLHDMLRGQCAICRGLPDVPILDDELASLGWGLSFGGVKSPNGLPRDRVRRYPLEQRAECGRCGDLLPVGAFVEWDATVAAVVGVECCDGAIA